MGNSKFKMMARGVELREQHAEQVNRLKADFVTTINLWSKDARQSIEAMLGVCALIIVQHKLDLDLIKGALGEEVDKQKANPDKPPQKSLLAS